MKRTIYAASVMIAMALLSAGCSDGQRASAAPNPNEGVTIPGKSVSRADITSALWADDPSETPEAACLISSSFTFDASHAFMILKRVGDSTEYNTTSVVIVSPIDITFAAGANDGRGAECGAGDLHFIVTASTENPIDIEVSGPTASRHPIEPAARNRPTAYPATCTVAAHFEKHGPSECLDQEGDGTSTQDPRLMNTCSAPDTETIKLVVDDFVCNNNSVVPAK